MQALRKSGKRGPHVQPAALGAQGAGCDCNAHGGQNADDKKVRAWGPRLHRFTDEAEHHEVLGQRTALATRGGQTATSTIRKGAWSHVFIYF